MEVITAFLKTYWSTFVVGLTACIATGCLVELFKQSGFAALEKKYENDAEKLADVKSKKARCACLLAFILTAVFLGCIYISELPDIGGVACLPIWFSIMYVLQMIFDIKGLKTVMSSLLGNVMKKVSDGEEKPKKKKMKKVVTWTEVED